MKRKMSRNVDRRTAAAGHRSALSPECLFLSCVSSVPRGLFDRLFSTALAPAAVMMILWACLGSPQAACGPVEDSRESSPEVSQLPFWIGPQGPVTSDHIETVMQCPSHRHGSRSEATRKMKDAITALQGRRHSFCWVCRAGLHETLPWVAEIVDLVGVNPFLYTPEEAPEEGEVIWPRWNHPVLNELRRLKRLAGGKRVFGAVNLHGEDHLFGEREATMEEVEWMIYAVVGSNYKGLVLRDRKPKAKRKLEKWKARTEHPRIHALVENLLVHAEELGIATPVDWASASDKQIPVAALLGRTKLFLVLLHPDYMNARRHKGVPFPATAGAASGEIRVRTQQARIASCTLLSGVNVRIKKEKDGAYTIPFAFVRGGMMLVCRVDMSYRGPLPGPSEQEY